MIFVTNDTLSENTSYLLKSDQQNTQFQYEIKRLIKKYTSKLKESTDKWENKTVKDFFTNYKAEITNMIKEYPKVEIDGVLMFEGMYSKDMPYEKEFIQAQIIKYILKTNVVLLPRYATQTIKNIFGINLSKGSISDGFTVLDKEDKYIEFKYCQMKNFIPKANEALKESDLSLIAINDFSEVDFNKRLKNLISYTEKRILFLDVKNHKVYDLKKQKEENVTTLPLSSERIRGADKRNYEISSIPKEYTQKLLEVNENKLMDYIKYLQAKNNPFVKYDFLLT